MYGNLLFFNLHKIKTIRNLLPDNICKLIIASTVLYDIYRIEYCNSLYQGLRLYSINCINRYIRSSIHLVLRIQLFDTLALPNNYMA